MIPMAVWTQGSAPIRLFLVSLSGFSHPDSASEYCLLGDRHTRELRYIWDYFLFKHIEALAGPQRLAGSKLVIPGSPALDCSLLGTCVQSEDQRLWCLGKSQGS